MKKEFTPLAASTRNSHKFFSDLIETNETRLTRSPTPDLSELNDFLTQLQKDASAGNRAGFILAQLRLQDWVRRSERSPLEGVQLCRQIETLEKELMSRAAQRYYRASAHFTAEASRALQSCDLIASNEAMQKAKKLLESAEALKRELNRRHARESDIRIELQGLGEYHS